MVRTGHFVVLYPIDEGAIWEEGLIKYRRMGRVLEGIASSLVGDESISICMIMIESE